MYSNLPLTSSPSPVGLPVPTGCFRKIKIIEFVLHVYFQQLTTFQFSSTMTKILHSMNSTLSYLLASTFIVASTWRCGVQGGTKSSALPQRSAGVHFSTLSPLLFPENQPLSVPGTGLHPPHLSLTILFGPDHITVWGKSGPVNTACSRK